MVEEKRASEAGLDALSELSGTNRAGNKVAADIESNHRNVEGKSMSGLSNDEKLEKNKERGVLEKIITTSIRGNQNSPTKLKQGFDVRIPSRLYDSEDHRHEDNEDKRTLSSDENKSKMKVNYENNDNTKINSSIHNNGVRGTVSSSNKVTTVNRNQVSDIDVLSNQESFISKLSQNNSSSLRQNYKSTSRLTDSMIDKPSRVPIESDSYSTRLIGYSLIFGLSVLGLIMITFLLYKITKFFRDLFNRKSNRKDNRSSGVGFNDNNKKKKHHAPVGLISGGKVIEIIQHGNGEKKLSFGRLTLQSENNSIDEQNISTKKTDKASDSVKKRKKKIKLEYLGRLNYELDYDFKQSILSVHIIQAQQLPGLDFSGLSDPYVKVYLMPDKRQCDKTRVHKSNLNPIFKEMFQFHVPFTELTSKTLVLAVYDFDRFSKHDEIGQVSIPMGSVDLTQTKEEWSDLKRITDADSGQVSINSHTKIHSIIG